jgi:hypothetical protein
LGRKLNFALLVATRSLLLASVLNAGRICHLLRVSVLDAARMPRISQKRRNVPIAVQKIFPHQSIATSVVKNSNNNGKRLDS